MACVFSPRIRPDSAPRGRALSQRCDQRAEVSAGSSVTQGRGAPADEQDVRRLHQNAAAHGSMLRDAGKYVWRALLIHIIGVFSTNYTHPMKP